MFVRMLGRFNALRYGQTYELPDGFANVLIRRKLAIVQQKQKPLQQANSGKLNGNDAHLHAR